jgi:hypothetical protein
MTAARDSQEFDRKNPVAKFEDMPKKKQEELMNQPLSERLSPRSPIHSKLINELQQMIRASESHIEQRYEDWDRVDEACRLYMDTDRKKIYSDKTQDTKLKQMPFKDSIKLPIIYSTLVTRVAVLWNQLTSRYPRIHLEGRGSEDLEGARIHEAQIQYDLEQSEFDLRMWQAIYDVEKYGLAVMYDTWEEKYGTSTRENSGPTRTSLSRRSRT